LGRDQLQYRQAPQSPSRDDSEALLHKEHGIGAQRARIVPWGASETAHPAETEISGLRSRPTAPAGLQLASLPCMPGTAGQGYRGAAALEV